MQVWNMLRAARWKYRTQKSPKNSSSGHHPTILLGYIFATIDNRKKKLVKQQYLVHVPTIWWTSGWDRFVFCYFGAPLRISTGFTSCSFTCIYLSPIIRPHRSTTYIDATYCYRPSSVVCPSVCHTSEPCKNGWTDLDAIWVEDSGGPSEPCIRWGSRSPWEGSILWGKGASHCKV